MKNKTAAIAALTMIVLTAAGTAACAAPKPEIQEAAAPDFSIADLQGNTLTLSGYEGKVLFINFWATWCPPCRKEIPDFIEAYKELKAEGLEILGVSVDQTTAGALLEWVRKTGINYPIALATPEIVQAYEPGELHSGDDRRRPQRRHSLPPVRAHGQGQARRAFPALQVGRQAGTGRCEDPVPVP